MTEFQERGQLLLFFSKELDLNLTLSKNFAIPVKKADCDEILQSEKVQQLFGLLKFFSFGFVSFI